MTPDQKAELALVIAEANQGWTDRRIAWLYNRFVQGWSFGDIGREMHASRNACISKANRSGWSRPAEIARLNNAKSARENGGWDPCRVPPPPKPRPAPKPAPAPRLTIVKPDPETFVARPEALTPTVDLLHLGPCMCKWPIGDPLDEGFGFCARPTDEDAVYCRPHQRVAYVAPVKHRSANELARSLRRYTA